VLRWHYVKDGKVAQDDCCRCAHLDGLQETDEFKTRPTTFIELEGTSLKAALDIARKLAW